MRTTRLRRITRHFSHIFRTEARTFIASSHPIQEIDENRFPFPAHEVGASRFPFPVQEIGASRFPSPVQEIGASRFPK